jgi:hypothetical protein
MAGLLSGIGQYDTGGLQGSPSIWGPGWMGADRPGLAQEGILGYTPVVPSQTVRRGAVDVPMDLSMFEGSNKYANYVRAWPDLLNHYLNKMPEDDSSMAEWGQKHWEDLGQYETDPSMEVWRGRGMWGDTPLPRTSLGPGRFQASRYLPAMDAGYDPRAGVTETTYSAGLPQPEVEGYKYEYPIYSWGGNQDPTYSYVGSTTADIGEYPYYPYEPTGSPLRSRNDRVLIGQRLVPK